MKLSNMSSEDISFMEQHAITLLMIIVIGLGGWNLKATSNLQAEHSSNYEQLNGKLNIANERIGFLRENFKTRTLDRYTGVDAERDKAQIMGEINILKIRFRELKLIYDNNIKLIQ